MVAVTDLNLSSDYVVSLIVNDKGSIAYETIPINQAGPTTDGSLFYLQDGKSSLINTFSGYANFSMNDAGEVVAYDNEYVSNGVTNVTAITWQNGVATALTGLAQGTYAEPVAVDDNGAVYGKSMSAGSVYYGELQSFVLQNGVMTPLSADVTPSGWTVPEAFPVTAVNHNGDVLGSLVGELTSSSPWVGYVYLLKNGAVTQLTVSTPQYSIVEANAINDADQVIGQEQSVLSGLAAGSAFLWQNGKTQILAPLAADHQHNDALAISDSGLVVGYSDLDVLQAQTAVVWQNGVATDLNSLLPANSGWVLEKATSINDSGVVVGLGTHNGVQTAFELTLPTFTYSAATVAGQYAQGQITSVTAVSDTAANVSANFDALAGMAAQGDLGAVTLTDSGTPVLAVTYAQLTIDAAVFKAISGTFTYSIADSAADVSANLDALETLVKSGKIGAISLTDATAPTLSVSAAQISSDADAIKAISGSYSLAISASSSSITLSGEAGHATTIVLSGNGGDYTFKPFGDGSHFTNFGDGVTDQASNVQALQFADHTDIVASQTAAVAGAVSSAQVTELYGAVFGRTPDVAGLSFYQGYAAANPATPFLQFAQWFLSSSEYTGNAAHNYAQTVAGDEQFITDSYNNLLHRGPAASDIDYYESKVIAPALTGLTAGTAAYAAADAAAHAQVLVYFSQSPEFLADVTVTAQNPTSATHWLLLI